MSIFDKNKQWGDYLLWQLERNHPLESLRRPHDDSLLRVEEEKAPTESEELRAALDKKNEENEALFGKMEETADTEISRGQSIADKTNSRANALYELLLGFTGKQESRYDRLIEEMESGDYLANEAARAIVNSYTEKGKRASAHAAADAAAANGGNPDTYAASQANRQTLAFLDAGHEAAQSYYHDQLERLLSAVRAASSDMGDLYGALGDNLSAADKRAESSLSIGAELLEALTKAKESSAKSTADMLADIAKKEAEENAISQMELDKEYKALLVEKHLGKPKYTAEEALTVLWKKYPSMRDYILEKYKDIIDPPFVFID